MSIFTEGEFSELLFAGAGLVICLIAVIAIALSDPTAGWKEKADEREAMKECLDTGAKWDDCRLWVGEDLKLKASKKN